MARTFTSSQGFRFALTPLTAYPMSMFCWGEHDSLSTTGALFSWHVPDGYGSIALYFRGDIGGDPVAARRIKAVGVGGNSPASSGGYSINTPCAVGLTVRADNDADMFLDGTKTNTTTDVDYPTVNPWEMGISVIRENNANDLGRVGRGQSFALWDVALTDDEQISLSKGFSPWRVRPQSLKFWWPGGRSLREMRSQTALTVVGTEASVTDHLRAYGM